MTTIIFSTLAGLILGAAFSLIKLPIPAPISFAGVMGIVGVWAGYALVMRFTS